MSGLSGIFLGTGASELVPSVWCNCDRCERVRRMGGRNRRRNAAFFVQPDILIDMPPELPSQAWECNVNLVDVRHLVITHAHGDHLYPNWLKWRQGPLPSDDPLPERKDAESWAERLRRSYTFPRFGELQPLNVWGSPRVIDIVRTALKDDLKRLALRLNVVMAGERFETGDVWWLPLNANHRSAGDTPYNYIIGRGDTTWLYGLDSGGFDAQAWDIFADFQFDAVVLDATAGDAYTEATPSHLNVDKIRTTVRTLYDKALLRPDGRVFLSHLNNHHWPPHDELAPQLATEGLIVACDGMRA